MSEFRRNTRNIGSYVIGNTLGEGAFGKVKLGTHIHTGEKVAIKILDKKKMQEDPDDIARVQSEIAILKKMRHKNIIQLYEIMESTRNIYLIVEYCEEKELFDYINTRKRLSEQEALKFFQEIIDALDYLHCQNIVHRDLKPENLLLDHKFSIKLSDFGLSRTYTNDKLLSTPCGTPSYAPPEMLNGEEYHGLLSDIWSMGVILYAMLCGYLPFDESSEEINCQKIIKGDFVLPDWISDCAADLINNILVTDPYYRYDLEQIKNHPWFNMNAPSLRPGVIIGYHKIPVDENILNQVETFGYNKLKTRDNLLNNRFCVNTAIYYLILKKYLKEGGISISDLESDEYLDYIQDERNLIEMPHDENYKSLEFILKECETEQVDEDMNEINQVYDQSQIQPRRVPDPATDNNLNEVYLSQDYISDLINSKKQSIQSVEHLSEEIQKVTNSVRKISINKEEIDHLSFKNFDNVLPSARQRSITTNHDNYAKRFANRKSVYIHEDLGKFFDSERQRRNSTFTGPTVLIDSKPRISVVLNRFRRNSCRIDTMKLDDEKIISLFKLHNLTQAESISNKIENIQEFQSSKINTLTFTNNTHANKSNDNINIMNSSHETKSLGESMSSDSNLDESIETVNSRKKSIVNNNIILDNQVNFEKLPSINNNSNKLENEKKTQSTKNNLATVNKTSFNTSIVNNKPQKKVQYSSKIKFHFKSNSKDKYNVDNLKPKIIIKRNKILTESKMMNTASSKMNYNLLSSTKKKSKPKADKLMASCKDKEKSTHINKFFKDSTLIKNDTSFEKSSSKTPHRNLSYSSHYAKKSRKDRIEEMPWNLKKKIMDVEKLAIDSNSNNLESIKGIIERYERFKQKHCNFKKAKNLFIKKETVPRKNSKEANENDITIQDILSSPHEKLGEQKANQLKQSTPKKVKKFVCFEEKSSAAKTSTKNSGKIKSSNYNTISSSYKQNKFQTERKGNRTTPFKENFVCVDSLFYSSTHLKEMFYKKTKIKFETNYKKSHPAAMITSTPFERSITFNPYAANKTNPTSKKIFATDDNNFTLLKSHEGLIEMDSILCSENVEKIVERLIEILKKLKITFIQTSPYKFKCSKNEISLEFQIFKLEETDDSYWIKFRKFQGALVNYRKLCQSIIKEIL